jgi:hypothetical protein
MLAAMSIENLLKAHLALQAHQTRKFSTWLTPEEITGITRGRHDLVQLLKKTELRSNKADRKILSFLTHYAQWAGRYMTPKSPEDLAKHDLSGLTVSEVWSEYVRVYRKFSLTGRRAERRKPDERPVGAA